MIPINCNLFKDIKGGENNILPGETALFISPIKTGKSSYLNKILDELNPNKYSVIKIDNDCDRIDDFKNILSLTDLSTKELLKDLIESMNKVIMPDKKIVVFVDSLSSYPDFKIGDLQYIIKEIADRDFTFIATLHKDLRSFKNISLNLQNIILHSNKVFINNYEKRKRTSIG